MGGARPTTAWIDPGALRANLAEATRLAAGAAVIAVVKADGYGHGAVWAARTLAQAGCAELAVATVAEGAELRRAGLELPILVLGGVHDRYARGGGQHGQMQMRDAGTAPVAPAQVM